MARVRSPAYPALSLSDAVDLIRKVHAAQQRTPEPRNVVLKHMGYAGVSGRSLKAISALIKYGFLDKHGPEGGLRVSERAMSILYPHNPEDKVEALHEAANEPALFVEIFDRWPDARPSEESLKAFLVRKGFNVNSVERVARAFYETYDLVSGSSDSYDSVSTDPDHDDQEDDFDEEEFFPMLINEPEKERTLRVSPKAKPLPQSLNDTKPIFDFETVQVNTIIDNQDDLAELIARLEKIKAMLPPKLQS